MTVRPKNQAFSYSFERLLAKSKPAVHADRIAEAVMRRIEDERKSKRS